MRRLWHIVRSRACYKTHRLNKENQQRLAPGRNFLDIRQDIETSTLQLEDLRAKEGSWKRDGRQVDYK